MSIVLILLLAVVVSSAVARMLPVALPTPLVQIGLGVPIGLVAHMRVDLDPGLFMLLFLPPLLFLDGWRIPKDEISKDITTIFGLALGLVLLTVIGIGLLVHWIIPAMPLAVAFALAAVISPTDPIAVSAIAARVPIPKRMMHILEGESLLNDASGLVCLRFAVAAALTGSFSASAATVSFLWLAGAGIGIGVVLTLVVTRAKAWISARFGEEPGSQILISLLIPFGSYLLAEHIHASGILAAVAAGVTMSFSEVSRQALAVTRMRRNSVWDTIQFAANGIIFVLLGEQLPEVVSDLDKTVQLTGHANPWWLALYVLAVMAGLVALRFIWVWLSLRITLLRRPHETSAAVRPAWQLIAAMSFAGVRGAVTLAGVLTLPLALNDGTPFPGRELAIFVATAVILLSLVLASITLPLLLRNLTMPAEPANQAEEDEARVAAAKAAIEAVARALSAHPHGRDNAGFYETAGERIMNMYRERIESRSSRGAERQTARQTDRVERELRLTGIDAERERVFRAVRERQIGHETAKKLIRELDLLELRYKP